MTRRFLIGIGTALMVVGSTAVGAQDWSGGPHIGPTPRPGTVTIGVASGAEPRLIVATDTQERFEAQAQAVAVTYSSTGMQVTIQSGTYTVTDLKSGKQTAHEAFRALRLYFGLNGGLAGIAVPRDR